MQAVFGKDALIGTGTNLGTRDNVYAPSNWGEKGFRGKVEKIADSYNNGDITLDEARAKVEDLLTPDKETNIDDVLIANQRAVSDTYVSLINMFAADPTNENFATIIDILESQVNRATGIFKGLIPVTSFSIKPEKGTTKGKTANKRMHNEHLVELFNANKNFLNILNKFRKGEITKEKAIFDAKVNAASLEQAVISERMRVEKDADGASVRSFANPLTFLGKDAQFQIPIGTRRLPSGRIFTGTNLAEFIAQELSEKQAKIISIASDASLSPEGIIVKNIINNKSDYQGAKNQNLKTLPTSLEYSRASKKTKTNQDIVNELGVFDKALNEGRKLDKPVKKFEVKQEALNKLGLSTPQQIAIYVAEQASKGFNDFSFDKASLGKSKAVKDILNQIDVKSRAQQARASKKQTFDTVINDMIESSSGIESYKKFSAAKAKTIGRDKGRFDWLTLASSAEERFII